MRKLSGEQIAKIKTLHLRGESERAIAKAIGCSRSAVWYQIRRIGFKSVDISKNTTLLPHEIQLIKNCISWAAQQSYYKAEETARVFGRLIQEEMYCDQPYYNAFVWRKIK